MATYPASTRALIAAARARLLAAFPEAVETADTKARVIGYGYGPGYKGTVATLILSKSGVKLGVPFGARLSDTAGLLAGEGKLHRHVAIATTEQLESSALEGLLAEVVTAWKARAAR